MHRFFYLVNQPPFHLCFNSLLEVDFDYRESKLQVDLVAGRFFFFPNKFKGNKLMFLIKGQKSFSIQIFLILFQAGLMRKILTSAISEFVSSFLDTEDRAATWAACHKIHHRPYVVFRWLKLGLPVQGVWVRSLVRELRSHIPCDPDLKKKKTKIETIL